MVETGSFDRGPPISNSLREHGLLDENDESQVPLVGGFPPVNLDEFKLLLEDRTFVDHFNVFLMLPVFGQNLIYIYQKRHFEFYPQIKRAHVILDQEAVKQWLCTNRYPVFRRTRLYLAYELNVRIRDVGFNVYNPEEDLVSTPEQTRLFTTNLLSTMVGMKCFHESLFGTPGEKVYNCWLDIRALQVSTDINMRKFFLNKIKTTYIHNGSDMELPREKKCLAFQGMLNFNVVPLSDAAIIEAYLKKTPFCDQDFSLDSKEIMVDLQNLLTHALRSYWLPRYVLHVVRVLPADDIESLFIGTGMDVEDIQRMINYNKMFQPLRAPTALPEMCEVTEAFVSETEEDDPVSPIKSKKKQKKTTTTGPTPDDLLSIWAEICLPNHKFDINGDDSSNESSSYESSSSCVSSSHNNSRHIRSSHNSSSQVSSSQTYSSNISCSSQVSSSQTKSSFSSSSYTKSSFSSSSYTKSEEIIVLPELTKPQISPSPHPPFLDVTISNQYPAHLSHSEKNTFSMMPFPQQVYMMGGVIRDVRPPGVSVRVLRALSSDYLAGSPFRDFLHLRGEEVYFTFMQFWNDIQKYLRVDAKKLDHSGKDRRIPHARLIVKKYLLSYNATKIFSDRMKTTLLKILSCGRDEQVLFASRDLVSRILIKPWKIYMQMDKREFFKSCCCEEYIAHFTSRHPQSNVFTAKEEKLFWPSPSEYLEQGLLGGWETADVIEDIWEAYDDNAADVDPLCETHCWKALELCILLSETSYDCSDVKTSKSLNSIINSNYGSLETSVIVEKEEKKIVLHNWPTKIATVTRKQSLVKVADLKVSKRVFLPGLPRFPDCQKKRIPHRPQVPNIWEHGHKVRLPAKPPENVMECLTSPCHLPLFRGFLRRHKVNVPLDFWLGVQDLKNTRTQLTQNVKTKYLLERFFGDRGEKGNLLGCQDDIIKMLAGCKTSTPMALILAQSAVYRMLDQKWYTAYFDIFQSGHESELDDLLKHAADTSSEDSNVTPPMSVQHTVPICQLKNLALWRAVARQFIAFIHCIKHRVERRLFELYLSQIEVLPQVTPANKTRCYHIGYSFDKQHVARLPLKRSVVGLILLSGPNCSLGYFPFQPVLYNWFNKGREPQKRKKKPKVEKHAEKAGDQKEKEEEHKEKDDEQKEESDEQKEKDDSNLDEDQSEEDFRDNVEDLADASEDQSIKNYHKSKLETHVSKLFSRRDKDLSPPVQLIHLSKEDVELSKIQKERVSWRLPVKSYKAINKDLIRDYVSKVSKRKEVESKRKERLSKLKQGQSSENERGNVKDINVSKDKKRDSNDKKHDSKDKKPATKNKGCSSKVKFKESDSKEKENTTKDNDDHKNKGKLKVKHVRRESLEEMAIRKNLVREEDTEVFEVRPLPKEKMQLLHKDKDHKGQAKKKLKLAPPKPEAVDFNRRRSIGPEVLLKDKIITVEKLNNDLAFCVEVDKYRKMVDNMSYLQNVTAIDKTVVQEKACIIVRVFLQAESEPRIRVNLSDEIIESIVKNLHAQLLQPRRSLFHEAYIRMLPCLYHFWKKFQNEWPLHFTRHQYYRKLMLSQKRDNIDTPHKYDKMDDFSTLRTVDFSTTKPEPLSDGVTVHKGHLNFGMLHGLTYPQHIKKMGVLNIASRFTNDAPSKDSLSSNSSNSPTDPNRWDRIKDNVVKKTNMDNANYRLMYDTLFRFNNVQKQKRQRSVELMEPFDEKRMERLKERMRLGKHSPYTKQGSLIQIPYQTSSFSTFWENTKENDMV